MTLHTLQLGIQIGEDVADDGSEHSQNSNNHNSDQNKN